MSYFKGSGNKRTPWRAVKESLGFSSVQVGSMQSQRYIHGFFVDDEAELCFFA